MRRAGALLLVVACGTGTASAPVNENTGREPKSRLRAKVWSVDGVELFRWFRDAERKEDCYFVQGDDTHVGPGPTHWCLPIDSVRHDATGSLAIYSDAGCTVPLALAPLSGGAASYVVTRGASSCAEHPRVYRALPPATGRPYFFDGTRCVRASTSVAVQGLAEEVPLASFVSGMETVSALGGPISKLEIVASDGSRQAIGGFDEARKLAVETGDPGGAGDRRWFPARLAFEQGTVQLYGDAACEAAVPAKVARDAVCPLQASFVFEGICGRGEFHALGGPLEASTLFEKSPLGRCVPSDEKGVLAYARGAAIARTDFTPAFTTDAGAGRVRLRGYTDGRTPVMWTDLFDSVTGELCTPDTAKDGQIRCLPSTSVSVALFSDPECTSLAFEELLGDAACATPPAPKWVRSAGRAFRVTGTANQVFELGPRGCTVHASPEGSRRFALEEADVAPFSIVAEVTR